MAVAKSQIDELVTILITYLGSTGHVRDLCTDLKGTMAYQLNRSFRNTIDRIEERLYPKGGKADVASPKRRVP